ncbi:REP-associated tyrosine transposase [Saccharospirillum salsuginis]|uniref:Transposase n=1 Tax=Saccharospirillum salsuginis TaxID=418750 RepID=A0A918KCG8_9GAMM|nr:transposase [Saccharospirillum salsuginis]GGX57071.1 transposase [Saccharospirillum salsuginis]
MPNYRRSRLAGGTYFFTVTLKDRSSRLLTENIESLRSAIKQTREKYPFKIDSWVVLPEHMHCIWTLPKNDGDYDLRLRRLKTLFTYQLKLSATIHPKQKVWQRGYWEHTIRDDEDFKAHVDYVHINPVKHGWVNRIIEWPYSTFHRYVQSGVYAPDWAGGYEIGLSIPVGE